MLMDYMVTCPHVGCTGPVVYCPAVIGEACAMPFPDSSGCPSAAPAARAQWQGQVVAMTSKPPLPLEEEALVGI